MSAPRQRWRRLKVGEVIPPKAQYRCPAGPLFSVGWHNGGCAGYVFTAERATYEEWRCPVKTPTRKGRVSPGA